MQSDASREARQDLGGNPQVDARLSSAYGKERILSGLKHLLLGKAIASIGGIGTLLLTVRGLSVQEFAAYSVMFGLVELLAVISSLGTNHILTRYVPEVYARHYGLALRRVLVQAIGFRSVVLALLLAAGAFFIVPLSGRLGLADWRTPLLVYLLVIFLRSTNLTLLMVLEAMLQQGRGQLAFAMMTLVRFVIIAALYFSGTLDLLTLILVEVATEVLGMATMGYHLARVAHDRAFENTHHPLVDESTQRGWLVDNRRRMLDYGIKGYLQHMVMMPFSGMVNRIVVGGSQTIAANVAAFGFAQSIYDLVQRYLPAQLFQGVIRPVMVARYSQNGDPREAIDVTNAVLKINLAIVGLAIVSVVAGGAGMIEWITNGKHGTQASLLLLVMMVMVGFESWRHVLDVLAQTVERYGFLIVSNSVLAMSLLLGLALLPSMGVVALPLANCVGLVIANLMVAWWLRRSGIPFRHELRGLLAICAATLLVATGAHFLSDVIAGWLPRVLVAALAYALVQGAVLAMDSRLRAVVALVKARRRG